ncbi:hypothetical protein [Bradyrhizobium sp. 2TAF24]|uniref:hypothetical protein n=1 Tax=Bradyrhizobium sp. 2TAF24 TaxID=3233011 RepID=UPI003F8EEED3
MKQNEERLAGIIDGQEEHGSSAGLPALPQSALAAVADERPAPAQWLGTDSNTLSAIDRLKATIDEETDRLARREVVDFDVFSQRKNRGLLELTRAMRLTESVEADPRVVAHLSGLRASLVRNRAALQIHLDAVREVSAIIARSIQEVESDGTYSLMEAGGCK